MSAKKDFERIKERLKGFKTLQEFLDSPKKKKSIQNPKGASENINVVSIPRK